MAIDTHNNGSNIPARFAYGTAIDGGSVPIWLAALNAACCHASGNGEGHRVCWSCVSGRAIYTNSGKNAEWIYPLGVHVQGGHTLAVYWLPGATGYSVEVLHR